MYVYLSEKEVFDDFDNPKALFWMEEELVYGDWTSGVNSDGTYNKVLKIPASEVGLNHLLTTSALLRDENF